MEKAGVVFPRPGTLIKVQIRLDDSGLLIRSFMCGPHGSAAQFRIHQNERAVHIKVAQPGVGEYSCPSAFDTVDYFPNIQPIGCGAHRCAFSCSPQVHLGSLNLLTEVSVSPIGDKMLLGG